MSASRDPPPIPPHVDPALPRPAPLDGYLSNLYNPALDPSPIGKEERGVVMPVRISRVTPGCARESAKSQVAACAAKEDCGGSIVSVLNGYRDISPQAIDRMDTTAQIERCIDVFVQGFSKCIEQVTLLPREMFRRVMLNGSNGRPDAESSVVTPKSSAKFDEASRGLTVVLAGASEWPKYNISKNSSADNLSVTPVSSRGNSAPAFGRHDRLELPWEQATRTLFRSEERMAPPPHNAFRLQFEPGPIGVELEEESGGRGLVQVRRVLQAGQAEQDGRLRAGSLIVAAGDWDDDQTPDGGSGVKCAAFHTRGIAEQPNTRPRYPALIRSLAELEEALLHRVPDRLFVLWGLDRLAPEVVNCLGCPRPDGGPTLNRAWSSQPLLRQHPTPDINDGARSAGNEPPALVAANTAEERYIVQNHVEVSCAGMQSNASSAVAQKLATYGWDAERVNNSTMTSRSAGLHTSVADFTEHNSPGGSEAFSRTWKESSQADSMNAIEEGGTMAQRESLVRGRKKAWQFETGSGVFNEDDQGLAARKQPLQRKATDAEDVSRNGEPLFPLGLNTSLADEFTVIIWFCNSHESSTMEVRQQTFDLHCRGLRISTARCLLH